MWVSIIVVIIVRSRKLASGKPGAIQFYNNDRPNKANGGFPPKQMLAAA